MSEYVPDSPTSVASSGPRSPQWDPHCDEDFTVPYWGWRWIELEESAARYRILLCENTEIYSQREAVSGWCTGPSLTTKLPPAIGSNPWRRRPSYTWTPGDADYTPDNQVTTYSLS